VFNGRYSTSCYIDATHHAMADMLRKRSGRGLDYFSDVDRVFMHRPYNQMPTTGWVMAYLFALAADDGDGRTQLREHCAAAGIDAEALLAELDAASPFDEAVLRGEHSGDVFPLSRKLRQYLRGTDLWQKLVVDKLSLGAEAMRDLGNLYSAALPAWLASGLRQAKDDGLDIAGQDWLALGYGSGDAAEALPMRVVDGWEDAAARINFTEALGTPVDLTEAQYLALHEGHSSDLVPASASGEFIVERIAQHLGIGRPFAVPDIHRVVLGQFANGRGQRGTGMGGNGVRQWRKQIAGEARVEGRSRLGRHRALDYHRFDAEFAKRRFRLGGLVTIGVAVAEHCDAMPFGQPRQQVERADAFARRERKREFFIQDRDMQHAHEDSFPSCGRRIVAESSMGGKRSFGVQLVVRHDWIGLLHEMGLIGWVERVFERGPPSRFQ
jgi:hypothetical protein